MIKFLLKCSFITFLQYSNSLRIASINSPLRNNNQFTKFIINTNKLASKTTRNVILILFWLRTFRTFNTLNFTENVNWKSQPIFVPTHINANVVFCFNLAKIFFSYRKLNSIIIKIINKFFIFQCKSFSVYFYWINMYLT